MKTFLLAVAVIALALTVAEPAAATCVYEQHTIDPIRHDTGGPLDEVKVTYGMMRCEPIPP